MELLARVPVCSVTHKPCLLREPRKVLTVCRTPLLQEHQKVQEEDPAKAIAKAAPDAPSHGKYRWQFFQTPTMVEVGPSNPFSACCSAACALCSAGTFFCLAWGC